MTKKKDDAVKLLGLTNIEIEIKAEKLITPSSIDVHNLSSKNLKRHTEELSVEKRLKTDTNSKVSLYSLDHDYSLYKNNDNVYETGVNMPNSMLPIKLEICDPSEPCSSSPNSTKTQDSSHTVPTVNLVPILTCQSGSNYLSAEKSSLEPIQIDQGEVNVFEGV